MPRDQLSAGREYPCTDNMKQIVEKAGVDGYDFIATYIAHPWCCLDPKNLPKELPPITRPDLVLTSHEWSRLVVAKISPWIDVDSADDHIRKLSEKALRDELSYFSYLCLPAILIELKGNNQSNLAKIINEFVENPGGPVIWAVVPAMGNGSKAANGNGSHQNGYLNESISSGGSGDHDSNCGTGTGSNSECDDEEYQNESEDPWTWFYTLRSACDNKGRIGLVLRIGADLPSAPSKLKRWLGEPLKAYVIDSSVFLTNDKRFPVLTRAHQSFIKELYSLSIQVIVSGPTLHVRPPGSPRHSPRNSIDQGQNPKTCLYYSYLNHLFKTRPSLDTVSEWALGYEDCLQIPLQPLGDNLESQIYETFEKDPVKYCDYKTAIGAALEFIKTRETDSNNKIVIMVLGAGRGPLVSAAIEALKLLNTEATIYAVEKNPNAIVTLNYLAKTKWEDKVTVVHSDMRDFHPAEEHKADIVVSELLGSFGDNELSPECLDGALHLMKPQCISIPQSYTSFVAPIHSPKLHQTVRTQAAKDPNSIVAFESSYVVRVHNHFLPAVPKPLFSFSHPNFDLKTNDRYKEVSFVATETCDLAGLVGYFRAQLFTGVSLSIVPESHTPGLFSWFPIFFPFKDPVYVKKGDTIVVNFWRCSDSRQVWYEWCLTKPIQTPIMNCKGRSSPIRKL